MRLIPIWLNGIRGVFQFTLDGVCVEAFNKALLGAWWWWWFYLIVFFSLLCCISESEYSVSLIWTTTIIFVA